MFMDEVRHSSATILGERDLVSWTPAVSHREFYRYRHLRSAWSLLRANDC